MKRLLAILLLIAAAPNAQAREPSPSPLLGRWAVDVSRLPMPPEARPKRVTITFGQAAAGMWTMSVDIVDAAGARTHSTGSATLDGTPTSVEGSAEADTAAFKLPEPNVLVL